MENHDPIYDQFRNAAEKSEQKAYPDMDKVWNRVEDKLDKTILTKENHLWKKIAVAASIVLTVTLLYQTITPESEPTVKSKNAIVVHEDSEITVQPQQADSAPAASPYIKPEAASILDRQLEKPGAVAVAEVQDEESAIVADEVTMVEEKVSTAVVLDSAYDISKAAKYTATPAASFPKNLKYDVVGVQRDTDSKGAITVRAVQVSRKDPPLLVVDGKAITDTNSKRYKNALKEALADAATLDDPDTFVLTEPLYIINSVSYSEAELFGPNPTSPYSPLHKQEIETISILQAEQATPIYGERGKKGVVIITTKNKKPLDAGRK